MHGLIERLVHETGYTIQSTNEAQDIMDLIMQKLPDMLMLLVQMEAQNTESIASAEGLQDAPS